MGTIELGTAVSEYNGRLVTKAFDAFFVTLFLEGTHMHFGLFDITSHDVLPSLWICRMWIHCPHYSRIHG
jgi:hypothetical protein